MRDTLYLLLKCLNHSTVMRKGGGKIVWLGKMSHPRWCPLEYYTYWLHKAGPKLNSQASTVYPQTSDAWGEQSEPYPSMQFVILQPLFIWMVHLRLALHQSLGPPPCVSLYRETTNGPWTFMKLQITQKPEVGRKWLRKKRCYKSFIAFCFLLCQVPRRP